MIMNKILGSMPINGSVANEEKLRSREQSENAVGVPASVEDDDVVLTATAKELGNVSQIQQQIPDMDMEKVARIRAQIENNEYQISAENIAKGLIGIEKFLS